MIFLRLALTTASWPQSSRAVLVLLWRTARDVRTIELEQLMNVLPKIVLSSFLLLKGISVRFRTKSTLTDPVHVAVTRPRCEVLRSRWEAV